VPAYRLQRRADRLFDEFVNDFGRFGLRPFGTFDKSASTFNPTLDISETDTEIKVAAELPGLDENDIDISLTQNVLTISGEKKAEKEDEGENYHRIERSYGSFERSVTLSTEVETDQVEAIFKNGVLTIVLPKISEEQPRKIDVKAA
jgi:HSP20 family protein